MYLPYTYIQQVSNCDMSRACMAHDLRVPTTLLIRMRKCLRPCFKLHQHQSSYTNTTHTIHNCYVGTYILIIDKLKLVLWLIVIIRIYSLSCINGMFSLCPLNNNKVQCSSSRPTTTRSSKPVNVASYDRM